MIDMRGRPDEPLGYLLTASRPRCAPRYSAAALEPLDLSFPQYLCMRILSQSPAGPTQSWPVTSTSRRRR